MDQTNNRGFGDYLTANHLMNWFCNGGRTARDRRATIRAWKREIDAFIDGAKTDLPLLHAGRGRFDTVKQMIHRTINFVELGLDRFFPGNMIHQLDVAYETLDAIPRILAAPAHHTLQWSNDMVGWTYVYVHNNSVGMDGNDIGFLHTAMRDANRQHQSALVRGAPQGMLWYTHDYGNNRLLAVTAFNLGANTATVPRAGRVNQRLHQF